MIVRSLMLSLFVLSVLATAPAARAQSLPVAVSVAGDTATVTIGNPAAPVADLTLSFDDATGLTPAALGVSGRPP